MDRDKTIKLSSQLTGLIILVIGGIWFLLALNELTMWIDIFNLLGGIGSSLLINLIIEYLLIPIVLIVVGVIVFIFGNKIVQAFLK